MKTMAISVFKAHALQIVDQVAKSRESILITKRGKPLARVVPYQPISSAPVSGKLSGALVFEKDIVSPLEPGMWEASPICYTHIPNRHPWHVKPEAHVHSRAIPPATRRVAR